MPQSNVDLVRELLARFNASDSDAFFDLISEDFVAEVPPSLSAEPDVYEGHDGVRRYIEAFEGMIDDVRFEVLEYHEEGDQVIADLLLKGRGSISGIEVEQRSAVVHWIERGKVTRMQPYPDLETAREALRRVA
jgi:ketosteroid isomerase-like protein